MPAAEKVWPDMSGEWTCFRHGWDDDSRPAGVTEPEAWEDWKATFLLDKPGHHDVNGQGRLSVVDGAVGQYVLWAKPSGARKWFSVNRASRHVLQLVGDDGWGYMFVRTEGGHWSKMWI